MTSSHASTQIDGFIAALEGWQRETVGRLRRLIHEADPDIVEEWKWGVPVYADHGNVCATGVFRDGVKLNVFKGASLPDPSGLFNAGLEAKTSRAIDLREGQFPDESALKALIREAAAANR
ncbi:MAG TPA: DUF1801 domain-containing protein [Candidatus Limnocylindrales bacterium]|nr:DUF1801 domain-containing protein [Candidatus Limnocylindrales bacterium]